MLFLTTVSIKRLHQILSMLIVLVICLWLIKLYNPEDRLKEQIQTSNVWSVNLTHDADGSERVNIISYPDQDAIYDCGSKHIVITAHGGSDQNYLHLIGNCKSVVVLGGRIKLLIDETEYLRIRGGGTEIKANIVKKIRDEGFYTMAFIQKVEEVFTEGYFSKIYYIAPLLKDEEVKISRYGSAEVYKVKNFNNLY